ncbi:restriction endonuclease subunit S [Neobacillus sp. SuZ13]|uniref:restriction endonuclease subunit S n=1 Tax=Neobacillus sp. SuZ13 TaxID=3047875 RepID=UPI0024C001E0|nr:restriction endonuclease subunit S [Neobacillus sp. SuZ13]WHY65012.1 restriction endonuclease subunit S [Neobacillus sp. SuZ13]
MEYWQQVPLQDIAKIGIKCSLSRNEYFEKIQVVNHRTLSKYPVISSESQINEKSDPQKQYNLYPSGTILVSLGRFSHGIGLLEIEAYVEKSVCAVYVNSEYVLPEYLFHVLRWHQMKHKERWNQRWLSNLIITLPPKMKQKYIINLMSKIDSIKRKHENLILLASQYTLAQYGEIIEKGLHSEPISTLGQFVEKIEIGRKVQPNLLQSGTFVLKGKPKKYFENCLLEVKQGNGGSLYPNVIAHKDDLLWYRYSDEQTFKPVRIHRWEMPVAISNEWIRLKPLQKISNEFLAKYLEVNYHHSKFIFQNKSRKEIIDILSDLSIKIPSIQNQQIFSSITVKASKIIADSRIAIEKMQLLYETYFDEFLVREALRME